MNKSISTIIQEMKHHRDSFMKKSTPYRQLNRAIKQLEKLEKIEQIVNCELIAGRRNYKSCYDAFYEIVDVIQDREVVENE